MSLNRIVYSCVYLFVPVSLLYYFLRFQFDLVAAIPVLKYALAGLAGSVLFFGVCLHRLSFVKSKLDLAILVFFLCNLGFSLVDLASAGMYPFLHDVKDYLTGFLMYFAIIAYCSRKQCTQIMNLIMLSCSVVALIYIAEFVRVMVLHDGYFTYTKLLNQYAIHLGTVGGVSQSALSADGATVIRMAGAVGHNNTTAFTIATGMILAFSKLLFKQASLVACMVFVVCFTALFLTGAKTSVLAGMFGMMIIAVAAVRLHFFSPRIFLYGGLTAVVLVIALYAYGLLDVYSLIYGKGLLETQLHILATKNSTMTAMEKLSNVMGFFGGYGFNHGHLETFFSPVFEDDIFYLQVITQYGVIGSLFFACFLFYGIRASYLNWKKSDLMFSGMMPYVWGAGAVIASTFISMLHTSAVIWPAINHVLFIVLACYSVITSKTCAFYAVAAGGDIIPKANMLRGGCHSHQHVYKTIQQAGAIQRSEYQIETRS